MANLLSAPVYLAGSTMRGINGRGGRPRRSRSLPDGGLKNPAPFSGLLKLIVDQNWGATFFLASSRQIFGAARGGGGSPPNPKENVVYSINLVLLRRHCQDCQRGRQEKEVGSAGCDGGAQDFGQQRK